MEEKVGLDGGDHVVLFLGDQVSCLHFEILLVLALGLFDVVSEGLLLDAGADHFLLVVSELIVGHGWLLRRGRLSSLNLRVSGIVGVKVLLEVLGISERGGSVEVSLQGTLHIRKFALHA